MNLNHSIYVEAFVRRSLNVFNRERHDDTIRGDIPSDRYITRLKFRFVQLWTNAWITQAVAINFRFLPCVVASRILRLCPPCDRVYRFYEFCTSERSCPWNEYHYRIMYRKRSHIPSVRLVIERDERGYMGRCTTSQVDGNNLERICAWMNRQSIYEFA